MHHNLLSRKLQISHKKTKEVCDDKDSKMMVQQSKTTKKEKAAENIRDDVENPEKNPMRTYCCEW